MVARERARAGVRPRDASSVADMLRRSPVHARHIAIGAKTADFGGWDMPIESPGSGVAAEHTAVRTDVGVFDVSHLGKVLVTGPETREFLNRCLSNDLWRIKHGQAQYTLALNDAGGVVDDLIAYVDDDVEVLLVPNAANTAEVVRLLQAAAPDGVGVDDRHEDFGVLAVQGPRSVEVLTALGLPTDHDYMSFERAAWGRSEVPIAVLRSGYTG